MNQRIRELIKQATEYDYTTWDSYNQKELVYYNFNQEKFAELIVRECIARVEGCAVEFDDNYPNDQFIAGYNKGVSKVASQVKQHFGVRE